MVSAGWTIVFWLSFLPRDKVGSGSIAPRTAVSLGGTRCFGVMGTPCCDWELLAKCLAFLMCSLLPVCAQGGHAGVLEEGSSIHCSQPAWRERVWKQGLAVQCEKSWEVREGKCHWKQDCNYFFTLRAVTCYFFPAPSSALLSA